MIAYFARTEKHKTLILQNVATGEIERRFELADRRRARIPGVQPGRQDRRVLGVAGRRHRHLRARRRDRRPHEPHQGRDRRLLARPSRPTAGRSSTRRAISGNDKLFQAGPRDGREEAADVRHARRHGGQVLQRPTRSSSRRRRSIRRVPISPEVARNANIPNVWTLDLAHGRAAPADRHGDAATCRRSSCGRGAALRVAFVSYYKGEDGIHAMTATSRSRPWQSADFGSPGRPIIDFTPPLSHTLVRDNIHKKSFVREDEAGRPPAGRPRRHERRQLLRQHGRSRSPTCSATSSSASSRSRSRSTGRWSFSYLNIERRMQYALQGFSQDSFYYGQNTPALYDPVLAPFIDRDLAESVQSQRGGTAFVIYPVQPLHARGAVRRLHAPVSERYTNPDLQELAAAVPGRPVRAPGLPERPHDAVRHVAGAAKPRSSANTVRSPATPSRSTFEGSPALSDSWLSRRTRRRRLRALQAAGRQRRARPAFQGLQELGPQSDFMLLRRQLRNARLRLPAVPRTEGVLRQRRAAVPADRSDADAGRRAGRSARRVLRQHRRRRLQRPGQFHVRRRRSHELYSRSSATRSSTSSATSCRCSAPPFVVDGFRLVDAARSYGIGLQSFLLGFPMHFDWSWKTLFNRTGGLLFRTTRCCRPERFTAAATRSAR